MEGCIMGDARIEDFENLFSERVGVRVQFLIEIETYPDQKNGIDIPDTGGRHDVFFAVHDDDVGKFALPSKMMGIRWVEDVLADCNYHSPIYPDYVFGLCTWNHDSLSPLRRGV